MNGPSQKPEKAFEGPGKGVNYVNDFEPLVSNTDAKCEVIITVEKLIHLDGKLQRKSVVVLKDDVFTKNVLPRILMGQHPNLFSQENFDIQMADYKQGSSELVS